MRVSMMRVRFLDVILGLAVLLIQQTPEVLSREGDDIGGIFLDDSLGVMLEDVGQFLRDDDLLGTVDSLLSNVSHK